MSISDCSLFSLLHLCSAEVAKVVSRIGKLLRGECLLIVSLCPNKLLWETLVLGVINFAVLPGAALDILGPKARTKNVCVCVCVFMYVYVYECVCVCVCICVCVCVCICVCSFMCMSVYAYVYVYVCICVCLCSFMCMCMRVYVYIHLCLYMFM